MKIKPGRRGASIAGIKPEAVIGMMVAKSVFDARHQPFQLSSGLEGRHGRNSLHFVGLAFDISAREVSEDLYQILTAQLSEHLGDEFDVVFETDPDHWHIEFQPERRMP